MYLKISFLSKIFLLLLIFWLKEISYVTFGSNGKSCNKKNNFLLIHDILNDFGAT